MVFNKASKLPGNLQSILPTVHAVAMIHMVFFGVVKATVAVLLFRSPVKPMEKVAVAVNFAGNIVMPLVWHIGTAAAIVAMVVVAAAIVAMVVVAMILLHVGCCHQSIKI